jgi:hypothetical protein
MTLRVALLGGSGSCCCFGPLTVAAVDAGLGVTERDSWNDMVGFSRGVVIADGALGSGVEEVGVGGGVQKGLEGLIGSFGWAGNEGRRPAQRNAVRRPWISASGNGTTWYAAERQRVRRGEPRLATITEPR